MEPALAQFESKYAKQINYSYIDADDGKSPEYRRHEALYKAEQGALPLTLWLDPKGKLLKKDKTKLTADQLGSYTDQLLKKK
jgi:hypothetical protein